MRRLDSLVDIHTRRAVAAATTEDAVDNARRSNVGSDIVQLQLRHNVSLRSPKAISAWPMDRAEFLERFYDVCAPGDEHELW